MADIVYGFGTSHSPLLTLPPENWDIRTAADRKDPALPYRGQTYSFDELVELRKGENLSAQNEMQVRAERFDRSQRQLDALGEQLLEVDPDILLIVGDDQNEWFRADNQPSFAVYHGAQVYHAGFDVEKNADIPEVMQKVRLNYRPPEDRYLDCVPDLGMHIIECAIDDGFDVTASSTVPTGPQGLRGLGHAYGFVYRRILKDSKIPLLPILINTYYPPNQPLPARCYDFGRSIGRALKSWNGNQRIAVAASGGLTHMVIDEEFDHHLLDALQKGDAAELTRDPNSWYQSGTSEIKNWIVATGILHEAGDFKMNLLDYVPCYRSEAGTGCAMGFATWT